MRPDKYRIVNQIASGVTLEDLRVHLPGKGSWAVVHAASADASKDLRENRHLVELKPFRTERSMPVWPFIKSPPTGKALLSKPSLNPQEMEKLLQSVQGIEAALQELLGRPSPVPASVLAAHVHAIRQRGGIPPGLPGGPDPADDPMFIPSRIVPTGMEADIQAQEGEVRKDDFQEGADALREARKK